MPDQVGRGRLAIGSGDTDGMQPLCGMSVEVRSQDGQRFALLGNLNPGRSGVYLPWKGRNNCGSTASDCIGHEPISIHLQSTDGHKQEPGQHLSRVESDTRDPGAHIAASVHDVAPVQHRAQYHGYLRESRN